MRVEKARGLGNAALGQRPAIGTNSSGVFDCLLVGHKRSADAVPCFIRIKGNPYEDAPTFTALIQTFKDPPIQAQQLVQRLRKIPIPKEIVVNDDSQGAQSAIWLPLLTGRNEFYVASPNLHEVRSYNRLAQMARGELLVFVQGDTCLPSSPQWMLDAVHLIRALPNLAMLSGRAGFDAVLNYQMDSNTRDALTWGSAPYKSLDHVVPSEDTRDLIPFTFAPGVDNGPLIYRRDALLRVGGFDESYSCAPGHLSGHYDFELSLRFWIRGWQVGVFYGGATNGIGGRKTIRGPLRKMERHKNELWNGRRVEALWGAHNATITRRLAESTRLLAPLPRQL